LIAFGFGDLLPNPLTLRDVRVRVFSNMSARVLGGWWADRSHVCCRCLACCCLTLSLGDLYVLKIEGGGHSLGLQFGEIQLGESLLPNCLGRCHLASRFVFSCLSVYALGAGLQQEIVSRARELDIVVHACQRVGQPLVEVPLVLHTDGTRIGADVC
jgi:hypothetical protein